jgi:hypothetical protein
VPTGAIEARYRDRRELATPPPHHRQSLDVEFPDKPHVSLLFNVARVDSCNVVLLREERSRALADSIDEELSGNGCEAVLGD